MATSKITKLEIKEGKNEAFIAFENKAWGIYEFTDTCDVKVGDDAEFEVEKKTFDSGKSMNFIRIKGVLATQPQQASNLPASTQAKGSLLMLKYDSRMECLRLAHSTYLAGKLDDAEARNHCREWVVLADALIDDLTK